MSLYKKSKSTRISIDEDLRRTVSSFVVDKELSTFGIPSFVSEERSMVNHSKWSVSRTAKMKLKI